MTDNPTEKSDLDARQRVLSVAYNLFSSHGIRATGVDLIARTSGVTKLALYRNFRSKEDLALAVLRMHAQRFTFEWLEAQVKGRTTAPKERLLILFDLHDEWFRQPDFEGCIFIRTIMEFRPGSPLYVAAEKHLLEINAVIADLAAAATLNHPNEFAKGWQKLLTGSVVSAWLEDRGAACKAKRIAEMTLRHWVRQ